MRRLLLCAVFLILLPDSLAVAEQITSTCRITAVDAAKRTITLVRKSQTGEKTGVAKVAEDASIESSGKLVAVESLKVPVDATVLYDDELRVVVGIKVADADPRPARGPAIEAGSGGEPVGDWSFIPVRGDGKCRAEDAVIVTRDSTLICRKLAVPPGEPPVAVWYYLMSNRSLSEMHLSIEFRYPTTASSRSSNIIFATPGPANLKLASGPERIPVGLKVELALDKCGEIVLPSPDYSVELPLGQIRDSARVARTRQKAASAEHWNRLEIECNAQKNVVVKLNGEVVNAMANVEDLTGRIVLNPRDSDEIQFRNATVTVDGKQESLDFGATTTSPSS